MQKYSNYICFFLFILFCLFVFEALFDFCKFHYRIVYTMQLISSSAKFFWLRQNVKILQTYHAAEMNPKSEEMKSQC